MFYTLHSCRFEYFYTLQCCLSCVVEFCRCGLQSEREESYINLCLDLVAAGSVSDCVQEYLKVSDQRSILTLNQMLSICLNMSVKVI